MHQMEVCVPVLGSYLATAHTKQVQGEAQGSEDKIKEFVQHLNKGPSAASVSKVDHSDISTKDGESSFNVQ
jgi:acylphosphatase